MSDFVCPNCNKLFEDNDTVRAIVLSHWKTLKSRRVYDIDKPYECIEVSHKDCNYPRYGEIQGD